MSDTWKTRFDNNHIITDEITGEICLDPNSLDIALLRELLATKDKRVWVKGHFERGEAVISRVYRESDGTFFYYVIFEDGTEAAHLSGEDLLDDPGELVKELVK